MSDVKFSIQIPLADDLTDWRDKLRRAEDAGFYSVSIPDHLGPSLPQLAPLVALAAAAAVTDGLRLAITVLDNDFRHPVMLAKEAATLDRLSAGRLDLGMGAGWLEEDYTKTGVAPWDPPGVRIDRLEESIALLRRLLSGESVDFDGKYYSVHDFTSFPVPVQDPLPIMVGVRARRMVQLAARKAQIVSLLPAPVPGGNTLTGFEQQLAWIDEVGGRDRPDLRIGLRIAFGQVAGPAEPGSAAVDQIASRLSTTAEEVRSSPFMVVGDLAMIRDHLSELAERYGVSYVTVSEDLAWAIAPVVAELSG